MDFDVLIIGSGAGGGMAALRLCEQGFKVGLIERGPRFDPRKDYILNHADWETRTDPLDQARFKEQTIDQTYLTKVKHQDRDVSRSALRYYRVHGVGGSTLHYQGEAHRFSDHAFKIKSDYGWGLDWPIGYDDLAPYYEQAEDLLGVAGDNSNPFKPERSAFPTPAHPLSPKSMILAEAATKAGFSLLPNTLALPSRSVDGRKPCQHSGGCNFGCVFQAKSSIDQAIIPRAEKTGNLSLLTETRAISLNLDANGEITSVNCVSNNQADQYSAKRFVLACGALETPRLMLASTNPQNINGLGNQNDQVGRYFMETVTAAAFFSLKKEIKTYRGPPLDARVWDFQKPEDDQVSGYVLGVAGYLTPSTGPFNHAVVTPGVGRAHQRAVANSFGQDIYTFGVAEQEPLSSNRVSLSDKVDKRGVARLKVHCEYSKRDITTLDTMRRKLRLWVHKAPTLRGVEVMVDTQFHSAATHVAGSCRMGRDPEHSVVDSFGKVHGQNNCYIADGSVMPTQGAGDSPSLTIQALALRTAEKIGEDLRSK